MERTNNLAADTMDVIPTLQLVDDFHHRRATRQRLLCQFTEDVMRLLAQDTTAVGKLTYAHIRRQLDLIASERYGCWFREVGARWGFDQDITLAAIAGSDVTRMSMFSETARANFGTTQERVAALVEQGDLRFGRAFPEYTALENLYLHAEGARHYTRAEILRRAAGDLDPFYAERLAQEASDAILGHDSFNAGFGQHKLKALLAAKHGQPMDAFNYATSCTPSGFLVQAVDRLEGCDPDTMLRYVSEGVLQRKEHISTAIKTGLLDNSVYLREVYDRIVADSRAQLLPGQAAAFLASPPMRDFQEGLGRFPRILAVLEPPEPTNTNGFFRMRRGNEWVPLESLDVFRECFLPSVQEVLNAAR